MVSRQPRKITFEEFGDLLQQEWEKGNLPSEAHEMIQAGVVPIAMLREKLRWIIERDGTGLRLSFQESDERYSGYRSAA